MRHRPYSPNPPLILHHLVNQSQFTTPERTIALNPIPPRASQCARVDHAPTVRSFHATLAFCSRKAFEWRPFIWTPVLPCVPFAPSSRIPCRMEFSDEIANRVHRRNCNDGYQRVLSFCVELIRSFLTVHEKPGVVAAIQPMDFGHRSTGVDWR